MTLLVVLLPALVAGWSLDAPPTPGERQLLAEALEPATAAARGPVTGALGRAFALATAPGGLMALPVEPQRLGEVVAAARVAQLAALVAISGLLYALVRRCRSQLQALLGCGMFAGLPPVAQAGHWLRAETPAVLFGSFAVVLGVELAVLAARPVWPGALARSARRAALGGAVCAAALALALSVATCPVRPVLLLWPGGVLAIGACWLGTRAVALVRRRGWLALPIHALNGRLLPWTLLAFLAPGLAAVVLAATGQGAADGVVFGEGAAIGVLPTSRGVAVAMWVVLALGAASWVWRAGLRLGGTGRIGPELVVGVYCGLLLAFGVWAPAGLDRLPSAPAAAVLLAEGLVAICRWGAFGAARMRR